MVLATRVGEDGQNRLKEIHVRSLRVLVRFIRPWSKCIYDFQTWLKVVKMGYGGGGGG